MRLSIAKKISLGIATVVFVIFGIPFIATLGSIAWVKFTSPPPLLQETADVTPVHVKLDGQSFLIPANYFNKPYSERSRREQTALIHVHWPDMSGSTKESIRNRKKYVGHLNRLTMVIAARNSIINPIDGRKRYYNRLVNNKSDKFKEPKEVYGLIYNENISAKKTGLYRDVYIDSIDHPLTIITCLGINATIKPPYPSCDHGFNYNGLRVSLHYSKRYLPEWKQIQNSLVDLFDRFQQDYRNSQSSLNKGDQQ